MRKLGFQAAMLALVMAPMAAHAAEPVRPNPKLPEAVAAAPLVPKAAASEAGMSYACMLGQAGGVALSFMLGTGCYLTHHSGQTGRSGMIGDFAG